MENLKRKKAAGGSDTPLSQGMGARAAAARAKSSYSDRSLKIWIRAMELGHYYGCHQLPERSFFIGGWQMPVCARCTGVILGNAAALIMAFRKKPLSVCFSLILLAVMGADWTVQALEIRESTNIRRLITGFFGGMGLTFLYLRLFKIIVRRAVKALGNKA